jgi:hypothetical protein
MLNSREKDSAMFHLLNQTNLKPHLEWQDASANNQS